MGLDGNDVLFIGLLFVWIATIIIFVVQNGDILDDVHELGQSICENEYSMDFEDYDREYGLVCKNKVESNSYDELKVKLIKNGE